MIRVECECESSAFSALADATEKHLSLSGNAYVEVIFVDRDEIRQLNADTRNIDRATDVLSYPALDEITVFDREHYPYECNENGEVSLGSIVICNEVAVEQAREYGHSVERETCYLFTHGLMHLLGYDHIEEDDRIEMRKHEEFVLGACNITRE